MRSSNVLPGDPPATPLGAFPRNVRSLGVAVLRESGMVKYVGEALFHMFMISPETRAKPTRSIMLSITSVPFGDRPVDRQISWNAKVF